MHRNRQKVQFWGSHYAGMETMKQWTWQVTEDGEDGSRQAGNSSGSLKLEKEHYHY